MGLSLLEDAFESTGEGGAERRERSRTGHGRRRGEGCIILGADCEECYYRHEFVRAKLRMSYIATFSSSWNGRMRAPMRCLL